MYHDAHVDVKGQMVTISSFFPSILVSGIKLGLSAWQQVCFPVEPSSFQPFIVDIFRGISNSANPFIYFLISLLLLSF